MTGPVVSTSATNNDQNGGGSDTLTTTIGSSPVSGDLLILLAINGVSQTMGVPTGFTLQYGDGKLWGIWTKIATGSEGASYSVTNINTAGTLFACRITGNSVSPVDVSTMTTSTNTGPSVTTTSANDLILQFYVMTNNFVTMTGPPGWTAVQNDHVQASKGGPLMYYVASNTQATAGATPTTTWTPGSGSATNLVTMAIRSPSRLLSLRRKASTL